MSTVLRRPATQPRARGAIRFDHEAFHVADIGVPWAEVRRVAVFKRDLHVVDMLCLTVEVEGLRAVELNEEMQGWQPFVEALADHLPGIKPWHEWFLEVAFPAFEAKPALIYSRPGG